MNKEKRQDEMLYFATNAFGELSIDYSKGIIVKNDNIISRTNLKPQANSIIITRVIGDNKIYFFKEQPYFVVSSDFYNITTEYIDFVLAFLLSNDFKEQKSLLSTDSAMIGINSRDFAKIKIKRPTNKSSDLANCLNRSTSSKAL